MTQTAYPAPPRADGDEATYEALRRGLHAARYYDREVCEFLGVEDLGAIVRIGNSVKSEVAVKDGLSALCHLFLWSRAVRESDLHQLLGKPFVDAALAVGLIAPYAAYPGTHRALAALYPLMDGVPLGTPKAYWVASDRLAGTEGEREAQPDDVVFCPMAATGKAFLDNLPRSECGRFLEVCAGCGPAALLATSFAEECIASDLAGRSVDFARFVARLNGCPQMKTHQGAGFDGLNGPFDRIAAHPPYMPVMGKAEIYYAGGSTGMDITESLVRSLPEMLAPGGIFYAATMLFESADCSAEALVRGWLGENEASYDVLLYPMYFHSLLEAAQRVALKARSGYEGMEAAHTFLTERGFQNAAVGLLAICRHDVPAPAVNARRRTGDAMDWRHLLWSIETERKAAADMDGAQGLAATYNVGPTLELTVTHRPSDEGFAASAFRVKTTNPFQIETKVDGWMTYLFARADGTKTGRELMESCIEDKMILPETPESEFAKLLWTFVGGTVLESSQCPLPRSDSAA